MPDAKILAGVNVDQAKASPFGQYVLAQFQAQDQHLQQFTARRASIPLAICTSCWWPPTAASLTLRPGPGARNV